MVSISSQLHEQCHVGSLELAMGRAMGRAITPWKLTNAGNQGLISWFFDCLEQTEESNGENANNTI